MRNCCWTNGSIARYNLIVGIPRQTQTKQGENKTEGGGGMLTYEQQTEKLLSKRQAVLDRIESDKAEIEKINAKLNGATGAWPAFWLLPQEGQWPMGGEIDIMERLNYDNIAYQTVHSHYTYDLGFKTTPPQGSTGPIHPEAYNVYAVEMYADSLCFFINDQHTFTYPRIETDQEGQFPFHQPFYLLLDMQLGGSWVGAVDPTELPVEMSIDWVRFYQK